MAAKNLELAREGQITDRFTKAIEQLGAINQKGEHNREVRLGGIYALERIAKRSPEDHWPIMEVLTTYIRENAPWMPRETQLSKGDGSPEEKLPAPQKQPPPRLNADIQAILTVLGRRTRTTGEGKDQQLRNGEEYPLNLRKTDLRGANLVEAHLQGADLRDVQLEGAILGGTHLEKADLGGAQLQEADLTGAQLEGADLSGAHLEGAHGLTVEQLATAETLYNTHLDPPLLEQIRQQSPHLLEQSHK